MSVTEQFRRLFGEEPSPASARALDEIARIAGSDDPMLIVAMFLQRHIDLFDQRGAIFSRHAGELERGAGYIRDRGQELGSAATQVKEAAELVITQMTDTVAAVDFLDTRIARLAQAADSGVARLQSATLAMRGEQLWWRIDLKLALSATALIAVFAFAMMSVIMWRTPPMSVETAAAVLVGRDAAPGLIALQQEGDLKAMLDCSGTGWRKSIGYCQPVLGGVTAKGWTTAPTTVPPDRAVPFEQK